MDTTDHRNGCARRTVPGWGGRPPAAPGPCRPQGQAQPQPRGKGSVSLFHCLNEDKAKAAPLPSWPAELSPIPMIFPVPDGQKTANAAISRRYTSAIYIGDFGEREQHFAADCNPWRVLFSGRFNFPACLDCKKQGRQLFLHRLSPPGSGRSCGRPRTYRGGEKAVAGQGNAREGQ